MYSVMFVKNFFSFFIFDFSSQQFSSRFKLVYCFNCSYYCYVYRFLNQFSYVFSSLIWLSEYQIFVGINSWLNGIFQYLLMEVEFFGFVSQCYD